MEKTTNRKTMIVVLVLLCLIALLVWYYVPIHMTGTYTLTRADAGESMSCAVDITIQRRLIQRARFSGTFDLDQERYTIAGSEDDSEGTGLGQYIESLRGNYMAYHRTARKGEVGSAYPFVDDELVYIQLCFSGWRNTLDKISVIRLGDDTLWSNCSLAELIS